MSQVVHVLPPLPGGIGKGRVDRKKPKGEPGRKLTYPDSVVAEIKWLSNHGFPSRFISSLYGCGEQYVGQVSGELVRDEVKPWPPSWINESEFIKRRNQGRYGL